MIVCNRLAILSYICQYQVVVRSVVGAVTAKKNSDGTSRKPFQPSYQAGPVEMGYRQSAVA